MSTTIAFDYPLMNISNITTMNGSLNGTCSSQDTSVANITYTSNNITNVYTAMEIWIIGNGGGIDPSGGLHNIPNANFNGELVILNKSTNGIFFMCFPLASSSTQQASDIDVMFNPNPGVVPININLDVIPSAGTNSFIVYNSNNSDNALIAVYTSPIQIQSDLSKYTNTLAPSIFTMTGKNMQTIPNIQTGEWMECDNVPIGSDTIATYNLPIQSGLVKDINTIDSFKTIVMFIIFFILCVFSYFLIPSAYLALINIYIGKKYMDPKSKKETVGKIDLFISSVLIGFSILFLILGVGVFGNASNSNTGDLLLTGIILSIMYIIGYVVIQSKKLGGRFIEGVRYDYLD
jgi:hypothetical protein